MKKAIEAIKNFKEEAEKTIPRNDIEVHQKKTVIQACDDILSGRAIFAPIIAWAETQSAAKTVNVVALQLQGYNLPKIGKILNINSIQ